MKTQLRSALVVFALIAGSETLNAQTPAPPGKPMYLQHCAACHGVEGDGNGPASVWLYPRPRDFGAGLFKIKSTPSQSLPTDQDLFDSITRGLPGSSMPSFSYLTAAERRELVGYVKELTAYADASGERVNRFKEAAEAGELAPPVTVPPEPAAGVQELTLGREVYQKMQCAFCHGETGAGDGPQVPTLRDASGLAIRPRDFNTGLFRGGHTGRDLYLRIHNGLPGTPMVPYGPEALAPEERWALVHYVQSLRRTDVAVNDLLRPEDNMIRVHPVKKVAADPLDTSWEAFDPVRVPLNPLWPEPNQVYAVAVSAVSDGRNLAMLLQWRDELPQNTAIRVQDFQDGAAVQFSMNGKYGFLGMGDAENPVNLWSWKAGWQAEATGQPVEEHTVYNSMHVDTYFQAERHFNTARSAGNFISQPHATPIEDANARGFGSFEPQPLDQQNVAGRGIWHDGFWSVLFMRQLKSKEANDVRFSLDTPIPVAFAVWNGEQGDRNGRKMVSDWYQMVLQKGEITRR